MKKLRKIISKSWKKMIKKQASAWIWKDNYDKRLKDIPKELF